MGQRCGSTTKNGSADPPEYIRAGAAVLPGAATSSGGAAQPAVRQALPELVTMDRVRSVARQRQPIGRAETSLALAVLMNEHHGDAPGAVEVTDGAGFDWLRWVRLWSACTFQWALGT